jgi:hypothetical protein
MAALGLAVEAGWPERSDSIAAELLHAIIQTIDPSSGLRAAASGSLAYSDEIDVTRIQAAEMVFEVATQAGWEVHDHVQMLAPFPLVVLAGPDPVGADSLAGAPGGDAGSHVAEELVQLACRIGVEVDRTKVECGSQRFPGHGCEAIGPAEVPALQGCDPLGEGLAAAIQLRLGAALLPSPSMSPLRVGRGWSQNFNTYREV